MDILASNKNQMIQATFVLKSSVGPGISLQKHIHAVREHHPLMIIVSSLIL